MEKPLTIFAFELVWHAEHQMKWLAKAFSLTADQRKKNLLKKEVSRLKKIKQMINKCDQFHKFTASETNTRVFLASQAFHEALHLAVQNTPLAGGAKR